MNMFTSLMNSMPDQPTGWVNWTDPVEGAFTIDVPQGWQVMGGIRRPMPQDPRSVIQARSPDNKAQIFIGDEKIPGFIEPDGFFMMAPAEGSWYSQGLMVMKFRNGEQYAREYGMNFFSWLFGQQATLTASNPDPTTEMQYPRQYLLPGTTVSAGIAQFSVTTPQGQGAAMVSAVVSRTPMPGAPGGMWNVQLINRSAVLDASLIMPTVDKMRHMIASFVFNQQWLATARGAAAPAPSGQGPGAGATDPTQIWSDMQKQQTQAILDNNQKWQATFDATNKAWGDYFKS
jgi:hypothetical protein